MDQPKRWGERAFCEKIFCRSKLSPGTWHCLELMLKNNTPGEKNGEIKAWMDGKIKIDVKNRRFRTVDSVKIRRVAFVNYFGGSNKSDTSPQNQRIYLDDIVISEKPIGCLSK